MLVLAVHDLVAGMSGWQCKLILAENPAGVNPGNYVVATIKAG